jgi:hypothetical protein
MVMFLWAHVRENQGRLTLDTSGLDNQDNLGRLEGGRADIFFNCLVSLGHLQVVSILYCLLNKFYFGFAQDFFNQLVFKCLSTTGTCC